MFVKEALLMPLIYLRLVYNILRAESNICNALLLVIAWLVIGPFYLVYNLLIDMYFYFKVLFDYHEDDTLGQDQANEDKLQDEIVIYNELIDTMRAIMNIFKYKKSKMLRKKKKPKDAKEPESPGKEKPPKNVHDEFKIRNELAESGN